MEKVKTYVMQLAFDGITYSHGKVVELLDKFGVICENFPFKLYPEPKELPKRDWLGQHGVDVYVPSTIPMKEYRLDVEFLYVGKDDYKAGVNDTRKIREDINNFIKFLYGRIGSGVSGDTVQSGRLAVYNEHTKIGRKDITVNKVDPKLFLCDNSDDEAIARFVVTFDINDPVTDVTPSETQGVVTDLTFT